MDQQPEDKSLIDKYIVLRAYQSQRAAEEIGSAEELRHGTTPFAEVPTAPTHPSVPSQGAGARPKQLPGAYLPPTTSATGIAASVTMPPLPSSVGSVDIDPRLRATWSTPQLGQNTQFVPNYRSPGQTYIVKLPAINDSSVLHNAPVSEAKLQEVYDLVYCSEESTNPRGEVLDQIIQLPIRAPGGGYNPEKISHTHLRLIYRAIYGRDPHAPAHRQTVPAAPQSQGPGPKTMADLHKRVFTPGGRIKRYTRVTRVRIISLIWFKTKSFFFAIKRGFSTNSIDHHDGVHALHKKIKKEVLIG